jgi:molecular chaperone DnaK
MAHLLGIDLGTTTTIVARIDASGAPEVVRDWEGLEVTPTAVAFESASGVVLGREARAMADDDEHVFTEFKRDMGTGVSHPAFGRRVTPLDLSALMLRKVREHAEAGAGPVDLAVITIPANFTNAAREATLEAARRAGFRKVHMINEPTAAALAYAHAAGGLGEGLYAVFDLGGGTFDVSLVRARGLDVEVVFTEGVQRLGGKDFDARLLEIVRTRFRDATGEEPRPGDCDFGRSDAEELKHRLSSRESVRAVLRSAQHGRVPVTVRRQDLESATEGLIAQAEMACEGVLLRAGVDRAPRRCQGRAAGACVRRRARRPRSRRACGRPRPRGRPP